MSLDPLFLRSGPNTALATATVTDAAGRTGSIDFAFRKKGLMMGTANVSGDLAPALNKIMNDNTIVYTPYGGIKRGATDYWPFIVARLDHALRQKEDGIVDVKIEGAPVHESEVIGDRVY